MSLHRWEQEDPQHPATEGLPPEAIAALEVLMDAVVFDPMDYARSHTEPAGKNVRHLALPGGRGQVSIKTRRYPTPASRTQKINSGE